MKETGQQGSLLLEVQVILFSVINDHTVPCTLEASLYFFLYLLFQLPSVQSDHWVLQMTEIVHLFNLIHLMLHYTGQVIIENVIKYISNNILIMLGV